eukprot:Tbor_TRINITY_DN5487_c8_g3::TRINITY_DN5487_c8_g3_i1::g.24188::m.24188/K03094/SKP1, CBF3D; S-phase kinase-associated protein 1
MVGKVNIILVSSDGVRIPVKRDLAVKFSKLLADLLDTEPSSADIEIPIENFNSEIIKLLINYMILRNGNPPKPIEKPLSSPLKNVIDLIDKKYIENWTPTIAMELIIISNFFNFSELRDLCSAYLASMLMDMSVEEVRGFLGVKRDFTDEEEAELRKKHGIPLGK